MAAACHYLIASWDNYADTALAQRKHTIHPADPFATQPEQDAADSA